MRSDSSATAKEVEKNEIISVVVLSSSSSFLVLLTTYIDGSVNYQRFTQSQPYKSLGSTETCLFELNTGVCGHFLVHLH